MLDIEQLNFYMQVFNGLRLRDIKDIIHQFKEIQLKPNEIFIDQGEKEKIVGYIRKGLVRAYTINTDGKEITFLLRWEGQFVGAHDSILNRPSRFYYEALEPTRILQLNLDLIQSITARNPKLAQKQKEILRKSLAESLEHLESFILLTPEQRYIELVKSKPDIVNRVPDKYVANILGITPVSLSRIRKRIAHRKH